MTGVEKVATLLTITGLVTTLVLPGRLTPQVLSVVFNGFNGALKTSQGR